MPPTSATTFVVKLSPSHSLADINAQVIQGETDLGTLSAIGNDGSETLLTFAATGFPATTAVVSPQKNGIPDVPAGATMVATGSIFIAGAQVLAAATRGP